MYVSDLDPDKIVVAGDWHGSLSQAKRVIGYAEERGCKFIVQLGDFGVWGGETGTRFLDDLNNELVKRGMLVLFVDGNHENFDVLNSYETEYGGHRELRGHIWHLPRGFAWHWKGWWFAALGGAYSVDKDGRTPGQSWWPDELVTDEELAHVRDLGSVDVMFMHDSPAFAPNSVTDDPLRQLQAAQWFGWHNLEGAQEHRKRLAEAVGAVSPGLIMHGHYHEAMDGKYSQPDGRVTRVIGLDEGGASLHRHTYVLDLNEIGKHLGSV